MTVHLAQIAAVQGPILYLWDLDEQNIICANAALTGGLTVEWGGVVRVGYEGGIPVIIEAASADDLTSERQAAMLVDRWGPEEQQLHDMIWEDY